MQLKVVAKRSPTFKGPITIYPLFNPPGVSSASAVTIPPNATETTLTINAAANAQIKKWKTAVLGMADAGKGPLWTSSQLATIEVAAPFVAVDHGARRRRAGQADRDVLQDRPRSTPFEGKAKVRLLGLPFKVTTTEAEITKDTKEISFKLTTDKTSPAGHAPQPVLPDRPHAQRRAGRRQQRLQRAAHRHADRQGGAGPGGQADDSGRRSRCADADRRRRSG